MIYVTRSPEKTRKHLILPNELIDYVYQRAGEESFTLFVVRLIEADRQRCARNCPPLRLPPNLSRDERRSNPA